MAITIHKNDVRAAGLYLLASAIHILGVILYPGAVVPERFMFIGALVFSFVVCCAISAGIWAGYRWVKILFVALTAWETISYLYKLLTISNPLGDKLLSLLASAIQVCAMLIVLKDLLTRRSSAAPEAGVAEGGA